MEIDFLITEGNKIVPVEVKSGNYRSHSSTVIYGRIAINKANGIQANVIVLFTTFVGVCHRSHLLEIITKTGQFTWIRI